jgi:hydroxymethylbilane synthase
VIIGTRGSELALWQARHVSALLGGEARGVRLEIIKTTGDKMLDVPLQGRLDKGFFTRELEHALLDRRVDLAVHSLKDLPTEMPTGLALAAVPPRADTNDLLIVHPESCDEHAPGLPVKHGAVVGTASLRRAALLRHVRPDLRSQMLRGNVPTRLRKCRERVFDAIVLARAGVSRLQLPLDGLLAFDLDPTRWLPAPAQGALGLQLREGDEELRRDVTTVGDPAAAAAVQVERGLLRKIEGGCHTAFGALALPVAGGLRLRAGTVDGAGNWVTVQVDGAAGDLVESAFAALDAALRASGGVADTASPWWQTAKPW